MRELAETIGTAINESFRTDVHFNNSDEPAYFIRHIVRTCCEEKNFGGKWEVIVKEQLRAGEKKDWLVDVTLKDNGKTINVTGAIRIS